MYRKITIMILLVLSFVLVGKLYACTGDDCKATGNVMTSNDGNKGNIFVYDCKQGQTNVGEWVDPKDVPELKGEKGDKGDTGAKGDKGNAGTNGTNGIDGKDGKDGINGQDGAKGEKGDTGEAGKDGQNGIDGKNGENGKDGLNGEKGDKGDNGVDGKNGDKGDTGDKGDKGDQGDKGLGEKGDNGKDGLDGLNGKDVDPKLVKELQEKDTQTNNRIDGLDKRVSALEATQYVIEGVVRVYDSKRLTIAPFVRQNLNRNKIDTVGLRFTIKLGKSYEEKVLEKQEARLQKLEAIGGRKTIVEKSFDSKGHLTGVRVHNE
jgi:hypothetical protein